MNKEVGASLKTTETGIFRNAVYKNHVSTHAYSHLDENVGRMIRSWNNTDCKYVSFDKDINLRHDMMEISEYVHITSPIRRMVDLLNQIMLSSSANLVFTQSENAIKFLTKWVTNLEILNRDMKTIRKTQSDCQLLERCNNNEELLENTHACILFGKTTHIDNTYSYMAYLTSEKILTRIKTINDYSDLSNHTCKLFMFSDEDNIKNKIKCVIQEPMLDMNLT
jgi:exoribonuclease R